MKKYLCLLSVSLILSSCKGAAGVGLVASKLAKTDEGQIILLTIIYELLCTALPLFCALLIQLPKEQLKSKEDYKALAVLSAIVGGVSLICYITPDIVSALFALAVLICIPVLMKKISGVSWGRAFGTLGLFMLFSLIMSLILDGIFG